MLVSRSNRSSSAFDSDSSQSTVINVLDELRSGRVGADVIVTRLADMLFIQAVRAYIEDNIDRAASGWLAALRDPQIGRALALLHAEPEKSWSVAMLAKRVGASRSAFAANFTQLMDEPPLRYLTRHRLHVAAARLAWSDDKLKAIAASAGYKAAAAFARAFKRHIGMTTGQYRRVRRPEHSN